MLFHRRGLLWLGSAVRYSPSGSTWCFSYAPDLAPRDLCRRTAYCISESSFWIHHGGYHNAFVCP